MTDKIRRRKIQIETHEVTIIRRQGGGRFVYCDVCQAMVPAVSLSDIALLTGKSIDDVMTDQSEIHFTNTSEGEEPIICGASLGDKI
jgi:hypothetical protein